MGKCGVCSWKRDLRKPAVVRTPGKAQAPFQGRRQGLERVKGGEDIPAAPQPPELGMLRWQPDSSLTFQRHKLGSRRGPGRGSVDTGANDYGKFLFARPCDKM